MSTTTMSAETFQQQIEKEGIVFVDVWASWCGPCRARPVTPTSKTDWARRAWVMVLDGGGICSKAPLLIRSAAHRAS